MTDSSSNLTETPRHWRLNVRSASPVAAALILSQWLLTLWFRSDAPLRGALSIAAALIINVFVIIALARAAMNSAAFGRRAHWAWMLLLVGELFEMAGHPIYAITNAGWQSGAYPMSADVMVLVGDTLFAAAVVLLLTGSYAFREQLRLATDVGIAMIAAALVSTVFFIPPRLTTEPTNLAALTFPIGEASIDAVLILALSELLFGVKKLSWQSPLPLLSIAGVGKIIAGVAALQLCPPLGVCAPGDVDDMVWMVIYGLTGVAAVIQANRQPEAAAARPAGRWIDVPAWRTYLPLVWLAIAYWLLTSNRSGIPLVTSWLLEWGTAAIIGLAVVRQALLLRENTHLYASARLELDERRVIEQALREARDDLESRVRQRTPALAEVNESLHTEIGERARAEREFQRLKEFNEGIIRNMGEGVVVQDAHGYIAFVNPIVAARLGYQPEELLHQHWTRVVPPDQQDIVRRADERRRRGEADRYELELLRKDGSRLPVLVAGSPQYEDGRFAGFLAVFTDISERKRAEAELQRSAEDLKGWVDGLERRNREVTLLNQMGDLLQTCLSVEEAYGVVSRFGRQLFPDSAGALYILNSERNVVEMAADWGDLPAQDPFDPEDCWAMRRGQVYSAADPAANLPCNHLREATPDAYVCVPLLAQGEPIGVLHLRNWPHDVPGTPVRGESAAAARQRLAVTAAEHIALSLMNLRLRETLRDQAIRDPLTGLFNRRYMIETFERELHRARRRVTPLGVVMFDLDHLKEVNDTHGHAAGDAVLRRIAGLLQEQTRADDVACRYGGDEFILILPEASFENTLRRAQELWREIRDMRVEFREQSLGGLTISVGTAVYPDDGVTSHALLHQADTALYQAKREGRDRVVAASHISHSSQDAAESNIDTSC